ncbi:hypothetical protein V7S76_12305 [Aquirufa sp. ROCK2-A2]
MFKDRKKSWVIFFIAIVLLNLGTLGFFWMNHLHESRMFEGPQLKERIAEELQLDEAQKTAFERLVKDHQNRSSLIREEIGKSKKDYYQLAQNKIDASNKLEILKNSYGKLDELNLQHFQEIRKICRADQLGKWDLLVEKIVSSGNFGFQGPRRPKINP